MQLKEVVTKSGPVLPGTCSTADASVYLGLPMRCSKKRCLPFRRALVCVWLFETLLAAI